MDKSSITVKQLKKCALLAFFTLFSPEKNASNEQFEISKLKIIHKLKKDFVNFCGNALCCSTEFGSGDSDTNLSHNSESGPHSDQPS